MGNTRSGLMISKWTLENQGSPLYHQADRLKLVTFCFGANDASINLRNATWRMVPPAEYKQNLLTSVDIFKAHGVEQILLLTPPPAASPPRIDRRLNATVEYAELVKEVGRERGLPVVDIFTAIQEVPDWKTAAMVKDGLHLGPVGQRMVFELVRAAIASAQYKL
jgi:lysophospholipase L1-like esterase